MNLAGWAKKLSGKASITVGSVGLDGDVNSAFRGKDSAVQPLDEIALMVESGEVDLVAVGRSLLADPQWARKVREGRERELTGFEAASLKRLY